MAATTSPTRPPALVPFATFAYKSIDNVTLKADIFLPVAETTPCPVILYIPGGGWVSCNRTDYSRPLFHELLSQNFIVCSISYRLLPETPFSEILEDLKDIGDWIRHDLPAKLGKVGIQVSSTVVVAGGSAGGHLALLTPKIWHSPPSALLILSGPTNMHNLPYLNRGRLSIDRCHIPECTTRLLMEATNYENPPSEFAIPRKEDKERPRRSMGLHMFRKGIVSEFLLKGLIEKEKGDWSFPEKGSVTKEEIDSINPDYLCTKVLYPPMCFIMGTDDEVFEVSHALEFGDKLRESGIQCKVMVADGEGHAFDIWAETDGKVHLDILRPAVQWISGVVGTNYTQEG